MYRRKYERVCNKWYMNKLVGVKTYITDHFFSWQWARESLKIWQFNRVKKLQLKNFRIQHWNGEAFFQVQCLRWLLTFPHCLTLDNSWQFTKVDWNHRTASLMDRSNFVHDFVKSSSQFPKINDLSTEWVFVRKSLMTKWSFERLLT